MITNLRMILFQALDSDPGSADPRQTTHSCPHRQYCSGLAPCRVQLVVTMWLLRACTRDTYIHTTIDCIIHLYNVQESFSKLKVEIRKNNYYIVPGFCSVPSYFLHSAKPCSTEQRSSWPCVRVDTGTGLGPNKDTATVYHVSGRDAYMEIH